MGVSMQLALIDATFAEILGEKVERFQRGFSGGDETSMQLFDPTVDFVQWGWPKRLQCRFAGHWEGDWLRWKRVCAEVEAEERAWRRGRSGVDCIDRARSWKK